MSKNKPQVSVNRAVYDKIRAEAARRGVAMCAVVEASIARELGIPLDELSEEARTLLASCEEQR